MNPETHLRYDGIDEDDEAMMLPHQFRYDGIDADGQHWLEGIDENGEGMELYYPITIHGWP